MNKEQFVAQISARDGDPSAAKLLWDAIVPDWVVDGFTPYPDDSLERVYGIAEEEKDEDLILRILNELDVPVPSDDFVESYGVVDSPLSIAKFVAQCRRK